MFEAMDNRTQATECFKDALKEDPFCHEAFHAITKHQMLKSDEEVDLLNRLVMKSGNKSRVGFGSRSGYNFRGFFG